VALAEILLSAAMLVPGVLWAWALIALLRTMREVPVLADTPFAELDTWPRLSVVSPACNEEQGITAALASLAAQDYPGLEVIAVDDRSTDRTGALIDEAARTNPRIVPLHVTTLPDGWLGKLNAMEQGVRRSTGDWFLLADADVRFAPQALKRAVAWAEENGLDFLTALPQVDPAGFLADSVFAGSGVVFGTQRPWRVRDASSPAIFGIGAFMLVRRAAYDRSPGLEWLKLEVADDMGLCLLMKQHGGKCDVANGRGLIRLNWYASFTEMKDKMQKNFFAIVGRFSLPRLLAVAALCAFLALGPLLAFLPSTPPVFRLVGLVGQLCLVGSAVTYNRWVGAKVLPALVPNLALLLTAFMCVRSGVLGVRAGGIHWRGQLYPTRLLAPVQRVRF
jgi:glycosyltransferase involved in cell wall biosynthesis